MDWAEYLITGIPFIAVGVLIFLTLRRQAMTATVYMIAAVKPEFPDKVEMRVSTEKADIDEWEKTFWNRGYTVSRRMEDIKIRSKRKGLFR